MLSTKENKRMTQEEIIVGAKYKKGEYLYLGIGKRKWNLDDPQFYQKTLICLDEEGDSHGVIVQNPEDCPPNFWNDFTLHSLPQP